MKKPLITFSATFVSTILFFMFSLSTNAGTCSSKGTSPEDKQKALEISKELISKLDSMRSLKATLIAGVLQTPGQAQDLGLLNLLAGVINVQILAIKKSLPQLIVKSVNSVATHMTIGELVYLKNNMTVLPMTEYYASLALLEEQIATNWDLLLKKDPSCDMSWPELSAFSKKYLEVIAQQDFTPLDKLNQANIEKVKLFLNSAEYKKFLKHSNFTPPKGR